jgi:hypothetical protein
MTSAASDCAVLAVLLWCSSDILSKAALCGRGHGHWSHLAMACFGEVAVATLQDYNQLWCLAEGFGCGIRCKWTVVWQGFS